jgi:hypothetical protein
VSNKRALFREYEVETIIRDYLQSQGISLVERKSAKGVDIQGEDKIGRHYFVEVEGNQKPDGKPLTASQKYTHFYRAIGQICLRMADDSAIYAVGLPFDDYYMKAVDTIKAARGKLKLHVYFIDGEKKVHEVPPSGLSE